MSIHRLSYLLVSSALRNLAVATYSTLKLTQLSLISILSCAFISLNAQDVMFYYDTSQVDSGVVSQIRRADPEAADSILKANNLAAIAYHEYQFVLAPSQLANASLAMWERQDQMRRRAAQASVEEDDPVIVVGNADAMLRESARLIGSVYDDQGVPLTGVTLRIAGGTEGTVTDVDGRWALDVPTGELQLEVRSIGFETRTIELIVYSDGEVPVSIYLYEWF